jgi:hypothetical protein
MGLFVFASGKINHLFSAKGCFLVFYFKFMSAPLGNKGVACTDDAQI